MKQKKSFKDGERNLLKKHLKMLIGPNKRQMSKYRYAKRQFTEKYLQSVHTIRKCSKMDGQKYIPFFAFK